MDILVVRHAIAEPSGEGADNHRRLTAQGIRELESACSVLAAWQWQPQIILCSPYVRTQQTADMLRERVWPHCEVLSVPELAPGAEARQMLNCVERAHVKTAVVVGHMPDVAEFVGLCIGQEVAAFAPGSMALLSFSQAALGRATLRWQRSLAELLATSLATGAHLLNGSA